MPNSLKLQWHALSAGRRRWVWALACLMGLTLAFIWGNSLLSRDSSQQASDLVEVYIRPVLHFLLRPTMAADMIDAINIRKLAHFVEYFVLGIQAAWMRHLLMPARNMPWYYPLLFTLLVATVDESLQFLSKRGPGIVDVGIDWLGGMCGVIIAALAIRLLGKRRKHGKGASHA